MMDIAQKSQLRTEVASRLRMLDADMIRIASEVIADTALKIPQLTAAGRILAYYPLASFPEINPSVLLAKLGPDIVIDFVQSDKYAAIPTERYDAILIPVPGFDSANYRLGHGGGWYDRLLAAQPDAYSIGLAFKAGQLSSLPHETHDIPLDIILTA